MSNGDRVSGSISVVGGTGNDINFYITDPNGNSVLRYDRITKTSFSFSASMTGTYVMQFDNSFSLLTGKSVTLDYSVTRSVAGIPQESFLILIGVIVVIIAVVIALTRRQKKAPLPTQPTPLQPSKK